MIERLQKRHKGVSVFAFSAGALFLNTNAAGNDVLTIRGRVAQPHNLAAFIQASGASPATLTSGAIGGVSALLWSAVLIGAGAGGDLESSVAPSADEIARDDLGQVYLYETSSEDAPLVATFNALRLQSGTSVIPDLSDPPHNFNYLQIANVDIEAAFTSTQYQLPGRPTLGFSSEVFNQATGALSEKRVWAEVADLTGEDAILAIAGDQDTSGILQSARATVRYDDSLRFGSYFITDEGIRYEVTGTNVSLDRRFLTYEGRSEVL